MRLLTFIGDNMATRAAKTESAEDLHEQGALLDDDTFGADSLNPALESLFAEMGITDGGEATVHVSLLDSDKKGTEANIWRGPPDNYDLEMIAKKFGSGQYRVRVYVRIATGQKVLKANKVFVWLLSPDDEHKRITPQHATSQTMTSPDIAGTISSAISEAFKGILPLIPAQAVPAPAIDPLMQFTNMMGLVKSMMPAPVDQLALMRSFAELQNSMRPEEPDEPIRRGGNAGTNDLILAMINKFGGLAAAALGENMGNKSDGAAQRPDQEEIGLIGDSTETSEQNNTHIEETDVNATALLQLKMGVNYLIKQAVAGGSPQTYAEVVLDTLPTDTVDQILKENDPFAWLHSLIPEIKPHEAWFRELFTECKNILSEAPLP